MRAIKLIIQILIFLCSWQTAFSNIRTTIHWPHHGDKVIKTHYEYMEIPANTTVWDFSHAIETGAQHEMRWLNLGDSLLVSFELGSQFVYQLHGDSLLWNGYDNPLLHVEDSVAPIHALTALAYECGINCPMYFHGSYSGNHAVDMVGNYDVVIGEPGTLILPNDTITNAQCVTTTRDCLVRISSNKNELPILDTTDSLIREVEVINRWYSPLYRYPLAENILHSFYSGNDLLQTTATTFLCSPDEQDYALGILYDPEMIQRNTTSKNSNYGHNRSLTDRVIITQNDYRIDVEVNGNGNNTDVVSLLLCDIQGHVWETHSGDANRGYWQYGINTTSLPSGYYLLHIMNNKEKHIERIWIK